ncbi:MAG: hypothetical protein M3Z04_01160, partial [Chloroflexota bacterium]|nr:hypothetical protein [Chloroflexota bacterium]
MRYLLLIPLLVLLTACGTDAATPSPIPTPTVTLVSSPSPAPSATPVPTATPAPLSFAEKLYVSGIYSDVESLNYVGQRLQLVSTKPDIPDANWTAKVIAFT